MSAALHARARAMRGRVALRAWEYRQRHNAKGVWYRLRRALADAESAFVISGTVANELRARGHEPLPEGRDLEPERTLFLIDSGELPLARDRGRQIRPRLSAELLGAEAVVLVRFAE